MMLIAGTIPSRDLPLTMTKVKAEGEFLVIDGYRIRRLGVLFCGNGSSRKGYASCPSRCSMGFRQRGRRAALQ